MMKSAHAEMKRFLMLAAASCAIAVAGAGCGSSGTPIDNGPVDSGTDSGNDVTDNGTADDTRQDSGSDTADSVSDFGGIDADSIQPDDAVDVPDSAETDTTPEFHWAAGCEGTGTGAAWTLIEDDTFPRGPLIQLSDRNTATVLWRTAAPSTDEGCVDYAWGDQTGTECGLADESGQYEITLTGLPPATEITYSARVADLKTADLTFRTMPDRPVPMKFAVFADAHCNIENLQKMTAIALAEGVDFAFGVGDFVHEPEVVQFDETFKGFQNLGSRVNIWTVIGNHDTAGLEFFKSFASPEGNLDEADRANGYGEGWWDRRIGNVWLGGGWIRDFYFSTDTSDFGEVGWFRQQFEKEHYKTARWRLFFIHEPPFCQGWGGCSYSGEQCLRPSLMPMAATNGIQATFHGHMHGYEYGEKDGVKIFLPGGLGGSLDEVCEPTDELPQPWTYNYVHNFAIVETACDKMTVRFMDLDGNELDRVEVPYTPPAE